MYEAYQERKRVKIAFFDTPKEVFLCDLNENEIEKLSLDGNVVAFNSKPFEIITIKIKGLGYGKI